MPICPSACPYDCPDGCSLLVEHQAGRITRVTGDPANLFTGELVCAKMARLPQAVHSPRRILTPLRRTGPKGSGQFAPLSWEEALEEIARRWGEIIDRHGPQALLPCSYAGTMGAVHRNGGEAFFHALGASRLVRTLCSSGKAAGWEVVMGASCDLPPSALAHSDLILLWSANLPATRLHLLPLLKKAKARGARVILIDVYESPSAPLAHHINGMQNYRAIMSLAIITGNYDVKGGQIPVEFTYTHQASGYHTLEHEFVKEARVFNMAAPVGAQRFPLWNELEHEAQTMDLSRQILEGTPYPLKALVCFGINNRMFPDSRRMLKALETIDFYVDMDLFLTDSAKYADIILPACSSFEREEFKSYPGGWAYYTKPVIAPLYESRPDADVMCELARRMDLDDELLKSGYRACLEYILSPISPTVQVLQDADTPLKVPEARPHVPMATLNRGLKTPTGKLELKSELIAGHPEWGLDALPTYREPLDDIDPQAYPMTLTSGGRLPFALHSRLHDVSWLRTLRPKPCAELHPEDGAALGIAQDDLVEITTPLGSITATALLSHHIQKGLVSIYHGYREADISSLINADRLDPYSGFPACRSNRCKVSKKG